MPNQKKINSKNLQSRFTKTLRRKVFFSNELKKALLIAYYEAQKNETCVDLNLLLYGLLTQNKSLACRLLITVLSQYRNNINLTSKSFINKINQDNKLKELSSETLKENKKTPWLMPEVKQILRASINTALQSDKKIVLVTTKNIFFNLLNNELIRDSLRNLAE